MASCLPFAYPSVQHSLRSTHKGHTVSIILISGVSVGPCVNEEEGYLVIKSEKV